MTQLQTISNLNLFYFTLVSVVSVKNLNAIKYGLEA